MPGTARLVVLDSATERVVETGFSERRVYDRPWGQQVHERYLYYTMSADDQAIAVAVSEFGSGEDAGNFELTVLEGPDRQPRISRVFPGHVGGVASPSEHLLQWSPDGRYLALQLREPHERWGVMTYDSLLILDARTLETVHRLETTFLMGTQSWSPESDALAVEDHHQPRILHLADGEREKLSWMKPTRDNPPRGPEILALLSDRRALVLPLSRVRARFVIADLETGKGPTAAVFRLNDDWPLYPQVSRGWEHLTSNPT